MSQQHSTFKWQKKKQHSNTAKIDISCQHIQKETHWFSKRNFSKEKKSWTLFALVKYFVPSCASPNTQVKEKERKTASFFHEEKREEFSPSAETSSYFFVFCQLALETYYPGVRHKYQKGRENRQGRQSIKKGNIESFQCMKHIR